MKLYYSPGACSLSPHIVAREVGVVPELEKVDLHTHRLDDGGDYLAVNPKGYVPALRLDDGALLTEGPAIVQYLADLKPGVSLAPANGSRARYRLQEWLNYISTEIHKNYSPLFKADLPAEQRRASSEMLTRRYQWVDAALARQPFLMGEAFSVADAYLFTVTLWAQTVKLDLGGFAALTAFQDRVAQRPAVRQAMSAEGLIK
ncbi:MAG: glutathione transferase GstA [Gammaproteobacteria bacterium]|nr:glutathione transferase GstA [Gammaproteobacteria bacterium]